MKISLDLYHIFYWVTKTGSFTRAAERLYTSQPAVSRSIRQLEQALGCCMLDRTARGVRLTPAGKMLWHYVEHGVEQLQLGEDRLQALCALDEGSIRVGASDMTLQFCLLPFLEKFHETYPKVRISVTNGPSPETLAYLNQGKIDFGVISEPVGLPSGISAVPVGWVQDVFIAGSRFSHLQGRTVQLEELTELPFICLEGSTSTRQYCDSFFAERGLVLRPEFELATSDLIVQFTQRNLGVGSVVEHFAQRAVAEGQVFRLHLNWELPPRRLLLVRRRERLPEAAEALAALVAGEKQVYQNRMETI